MKKVCCFFLLAGMIGFWSCGDSDKEVERKKKLEAELVMLKNQAFCNLYHKSLAKADGLITPADGSNYIHVSELVENYVYDDRLSDMIDSWLAKPYNSKDATQELYLMRCLDFYNSAELSSFIDSVRTVENSKN